MRHIPSLLLACLIFFSGTSVAKEYQVTVSFYPSGQHPPVRLITNDTHCLLATSQWSSVGFTDGGARTKVKAGKEEGLPAICQEQHSSAIFYVVDDHNQPLLVFEFYQPQGGHPRLIKLSEAKDVYCKVFSDTDIGCQPYPYYGESS